MTLAPHQARANIPPVDCAALLADEFALSVAPETRRGLGQFFTPPPIARFMGGLASLEKRTIRVLDPCAGTGVLACGVLEALSPHTKEIHIDAFEVDPELAERCKKSLEHAQQWLKAQGRRLRFAVRCEDFVLALGNTLAPSLFTVGSAPQWDVVIANPPYFKLSKSDPRATAAACVVHGQPNIYGLFMAIAAQVLAPQGLMVTITPRSFATGDYFRAMRDFVFSLVVPERLHLFRSRKDAFRSDGVLQENVIVQARKTARSTEAIVGISESEGSLDIAEGVVPGFPLSCVLLPRSEGSILRLPTGDIDHQIVEFSSTLGQTLGGLGLCVSTGPVVAFRAREYLASEPRGQAQFAPLIWLSNVQDMRVTWPSMQRNKPQFIRIASRSVRLLIPNGNYVLLRRFSSKEQRQRLTAAPLLARDHDSQLIGLENHLNYIYRLNGAVRKGEAIALSALLGSSLYDRLFRISNGHTQVNATELRTMPMPSGDVIRGIGDRLAKQDLASRSEIDDVIFKVMQVPSALAERIKGITNGCR